MMWTTRLNRRVLRVCCRRVGVGVVLMFLSLTTGVHAQSPEWIVYTPENSELPSEEVIGLTVDPGGGLWIGTRWGGLAKVDGETWTVYTTDNSKLPSNTVPALAFGAQGQLWAGTGDGLSMFDGKAWYVFTTERTDLPYHAVHALAVDAQGMLWVGTGRFDALGGGGLVKMERWKWAVYTTDNSGLPHGWVWVLTPDIQGNLWIGMKDGLAVYREGGILFPEKATKIEDLVGIWKGWFKGRVAYYQFEADGTLTLGYDVKGLEDYPILSGTVWFEESLFKILESLKPDEIGTYEVHVRKKDGKAVHLSFRAIDDTGFSRPHDLGRGMTRVEP